MAMTIRWDQAAFDELSRSPAVAQEVKRRADNIAEAAGPGFRSAVQQRRDRVGAVVWSGTYAAREAEHYDRALTRAIDAGRD